MHSAPPPNIPPVAPRPAPAPRAAFAFGPGARPSPFFEATLRWGASAFTIYNHTLMPSVYESPQQDYQHLINAATLWDVSAERQVQIEGKDAAALTQRLTPRNLGKCAVGRCAYAPLTAHNGGVINDPIVLRLREDLFWLSLSDGDMLYWCRALAEEGNYKVKVTTPDVSPLQLQGPLAAKTAAAFFGAWAAELPYFALRECEANGIPLVVSRTGWSGEWGYEIYLRDGERGDELWEGLMAAGKPFGIRPCAPSAIRRIEAGFLSCRADVAEDDTPFHLNMQRLVNLDDGFDFIGKKALLQTRERGINRRLTGVVLEGEPLTAPQARWWNAYNNNGERVGKIRHSVYSPTLQKNIGVAMLNKPFDEAGARFFARAEWGDIYTCQAANLPFVAAKTK